MQAACKWLKAVDHAAWNIEEHIWGRSIYPAIFQVLDADADADNPLELHLGTVDVMLRTDALDDDTCE